MRCPPQQTSSRRGRGCQSKKSKAKRDDVFSRYKEILTILVPDWTQKEAIKVQFESSFEKFWSRLFDENNSRGCLLSQKNIRTLSAPLIRGQIPPIFDTDETRTDFLESIYDSLSRESLKGGRSGSTKNKIWRSFAEAIEIDHTHQYTYTEVEEAFTMWTNKTEPLSVKWEYD